MTWIAVWCEAPKTLLGPFIQKEHPTAVWHGPSLCVEVFLGGTNTSQSSIVTLPRVEKPWKKRKQLLCSKLFGQNISTPLPNKIDILRRVLGYPRKLGSMVRKRVITYLQLGYIGGYIPLILTFDPNFPGHPSMFLWGFDHFDQDVLRWKPGEVAP